MVAGISESADFLRCSHKKWMVEKKQKISSSSVCRNALLKVRGQWLDRFSSTQEPESNLHNHSLQPWWAERHVKDTSGSFLVWYDQDSERDTPGTGPPELDIFQEKHRMVFFLLFIFFLLTSPSQFSPTRHLSPMSQQLPTREGKGYPMHCPSHMKPAAASFQTAAHAVSGVA